MKKNKSDMELLNELALRVVDTLPYSVDEDKIAEMIERQVRDALNMDGRTITKYKEEEPLKLDNVIEKVIDRVTKQVEDNYLEKAKRAMYALPLTIEEFDVNARQDWVDEFYDDYDNISAAIKKHTKDIPATAEMIKEVGRLNNEVITEYILNGDEYAFHHYIKGSKEYLKRLFEAEDIIDTYGADPESEKHKKKVRNKIRWAVDTMHLFKEPIVENLLHREYKPRGFIYDGAMPDGVGEMFGESQAMKSFVLMSLAFCVAHGIKYNGKETAHGKVIFLIGEGEEEARKRFEALSAHYGIPLDKKRLRLLTVSQLNIDFQKSDQVDVLAARIENYGGDFRWLVIDTLKSFAPGFELLKNTGWGNIFTNIKKLRQYCSTITWVTHTPDNNKLKSSGNSERRNSADYEIGVVKQKDGISTKLIFSKDKGGAKWEDKLLRFERFDTGDKDGTLVPADSTPKPETKEVKKAPKKVDEVAPKLDGKYLEIYNRIKDDVSKFNDAVDAVFEMEESTSQQKANKRSYVKKKLQESGFKF